MRSRKESCFLTIGDKKVRVEITDEETGKVLYSHALEAVVFCGVEEYRVENKEEGVIWGNQQHIVWGKPAVWTHAAIKLRQQVDWLMYEERLQSRNETDALGRDATQGQLF